MLKKIRNAYYDVVANMLLMVVFALIMILIDEVYWYSLDSDNKCKLVEDFHTKITEELSIDDTIELGYYIEHLNKETGRVKYGYYSNKTKGLFINKNLFNMSKYNLVNTLAHETMHYWQYNIASSGDETYAVEMRHNIRDYSSRQVDPDNDYTDYRMNPIERQARAYAKRFEQRYIVEKYGRLIMLSFQLYSMTLISIIITKMLYKNLRGIK